MNKINMVYREVAEEALRNRRAKLVGREIARKIKVSPDTVSAALAPLKRIGAVEMHKRHFEVINFKKLLLSWAVNRKFERDATYATFVEAKAVSEIEDRLPDGIAYTSYSGYVRLFGNDVGTYGEVYAYASEGVLGEIKRKFPEMKLTKRSAYKNLIILKPDALLEERISGHELPHSTVSLPQLYVDLWSISSWYAYEFLKKLEKRIDDVYVNAILE